MIAARFIAELEPRGADQAVRWRGNQPSGELSGIIDSGLIGAVSRPVGWPSLAGWDQSAAVASHHVAASYWTVLRLGVKFYDCYCLVKSPFFRALIIDLVLNMDLAEIPKRISLPLLYSLLDFTRGSACVDLEFFEFLNYYFLLHPILV